MSQSYTGKMRNNLPILGQEYQGHQCYFCSRPVPNCVLCLVISYAISHLNPVLCNPSSASQILWGTRVDTGSAHFQNTYVAGCRQKLRWRAELRPER